MGVAALAALTAVAVTGSYFRIDTTPPIPKSPTISSKPAPIPTPLKTQRGVVRSNCMDCLDRTNVTQAAIGKDVLQRQLRDVGILSHKETIDEHVDFMHIFRNGQSRRRH